MHAIARPRVYHSNGLTREFLRINFSSRRSYSSRALKPLRILFCGSDDVSSASLRALYDEQKRNPSSIASIDVFCRPGKPYGRGLKKIREVPLKETAESLGLRTHIRDTFTGWKVPQVDGESINLIIAVSFGLFVPPRVLNSTEYLGLNLHLSLLPDLRGPSPVHYAVLNSYTRTGVTLQSLSPKAFDHGKILLQAPISIPNPKEITQGALRDIMIPVSANLLVQGLRERVYSLGSPTFEPMQPLESPIIHAPKIKSEDMRMLSKMTAEEIVRMERAFSKVWTISKLANGCKKRVILEDLKAIPIPEEISNLYHAHENEMGTFKPFVFMEGDDETEKAIAVPMMKAPDGHGIIIPTRGDRALLIRNATIDGKRKTTAAVALYGKDLEKSSDENWFGSAGEVIYWDTLTNTRESATHH